MSKLYAISYNDMYFKGIDGLTDLAGHVDEENKILIRALVEQLATKHPDKLLSLSKGVDVSFSTASEAESYIGSIESALLSIQDSLTLSVGLCDLMIKDLSLVEVEASEEVSETVSDWCVCAYYEGEGFNYYVETELFGMPRIEWVDGSQLNKSWANKDYLVAIGKAKEVSRQTGIYAFPFLKSLAD